MFGGNARLTFESKQKCDAHSLDIFMRRFAVISMQSAGRINLSLGKIFPTCVTYPFRSMSVSHKISTCLQLSRQKYRNIPGSFYSTARVNGMGNHVAITFTRAGVSSVFLGI